MVTQKPISLKIDTELLQELDEEVRLGWRKRNCLINQAIALYLEVKDLNRRLSDKQISVELSAEAKQYVADSGYDPVFGARRRTEKAFPQLRRTSGT